MKITGKWLAVAVLLLPIVTLGGLEKRISEERRALKYGGAPVTLALRDRLGQGMTIGLLAGFRGVVADFLWIRNVSLWENMWQPGTDKARIFVHMYSNMETVTLLQPHAILFWEESAWHMAWNIGYAVRIDPSNRTKAEGQRRDREWRETARKFLEDGIQNNPNHYRLYFYLGILYARKLADPVKAADYFLKATSFPDAPSYCARQHAHYLEVAGKKAEAYAYWKSIWNNGNIRRFGDTIDMAAAAKREIRRLEDELNIPQPQRLFPST